MTIQSDLEQGNFTEALQSLSWELARNPEPGKYFMSFELRAVIEDFSGALRDIEQVIRLAPNMADAMMELRYCVQAAELRAKRLKDPVLAQRRAALEAPPAFALSYVKAAVMHAQQDYPAARAAIQEAKQATPPLRGAVTLTTGRVIEFDSFGDTDELIGPTLVCNSSQLLDIPLHSLRAINFMTPRGYQDILWMPAQVTTKSGQQVFVRVFSYYSGSGVHSEPSVRKSALTLWERSTGYAIGSGMVDLMAGGSLLGIRNIQQVHFRS